MWKGPFGVQNVPFSRDYGPDLARKWATTAPVLPRKTLVLATMLWSAVDGMAVFPRSLARDLHAGCGFNAEAYPESRRAGIERDAEGGLGGQQTLDPPSPFGLRRAGSGLWTASCGAALEMDDGLRLRTVEASRTVSADSISTSRRLTGTWRRLRVTSGPRGRRAG